MTIQFDCQYFDFALHPETIACGGDRWLSNIAHWAGQARITVVCFICVPGV